MSITNKTQAINNITTAITSDTDGTANLNPSNGFPIKYTNLSSFLTEFINYLFPTISGSVDLHGKSPIFRNTDSLGNYTEVNTEYKNLTYQEIVPIGGIIMYGKAGDNSNINDELDGYLYCDGRVYDTTISTNFKYKRLYAIIGQSFHNPGNPLHGQSPAANMLYLPDFRSKSPIGYDAMGGSNVRVETGNGNNTQGIGNMGGSNTTTLITNNLPIHNHGISSTAGGSAALSVSATISNSGAHQHFFANATYLQNNSIYNGNSTLFGYSQTYSGITYANNSFGTQNSDPDNMPIAFYDKTIPGGSSIGISPGNTQYNDGGAHTHPVVVSSSLSGSTNNAGSGQAFNNRSAYVVTNYIIKY